MKLSKTLITSGRYYQAGQEIPDDRVPPAYVRYKVSDPVIDPGSKRESAQADLDAALKHSAHKPARRPGTVRKWGAQ